MIRARIAVEESHATAMNCEDARDWLTVLAAGGIGLTEWALLEAHLKQCVVCRQTDALLPAGGRVQSFGHAATSSTLAVRCRALLTTAAGEITLRAAAGAVRVIGLAVGRSAELMARIRASMAGAPELAALVVLVVARGVQAFAGGARLRAALAIPLRSSVAVVTRLRAARLGITRFAKQAVRFRSVRAVGVVLALVLTLYAMPRTDELPKLARPPASSPAPGPTQLEPAQVEGTRSELTQLAPAPPEPAQPAPSRPEPSVERKSVPAPPRTDERRPSPGGTPSPAALLPPSDGALSEPVRGAVSSLQTGLSDLSPVHVVGRLVAKSPGAAQRGFIALLGEVGGAELGRSRQVRFTAVDVVVPRSHYDEFADGLARIGSWQLEAARFPLPHAVHITIRINE